MGLTICLRRSESFCIVTYYIKCVTTSWAHSILGGSSEISERVDQEQSQIDYFFFEKTSLMRAQHALSYHLITIDLLWNPYSQYDPLKCDK